MMYHCILKLGGLVTLASAVALNHQSPVHQPRDDFPDIEAIMSKDPSTFKSYPVHALSRADSNSNSATTADWTCNAQAAFTWGDNPGSGEPGIFITNGDTTQSGYRSFYFYHNLCDAIPYKYIYVGPRETRFVALPALFEGRVTRGIDSWNLAGKPQTLATWFEFAINEGGWAWSDLSLIRGCDGGVVLWATDGSGAWKGFAQSILDGAPADAYAKKDSGVVILNQSINWDGTINTAVRDWELKQVGPDHAYVDDNHGNPVITSTNGRLATFWSAGRP